VTGLLEPRLTQEEADAFYALLIEAHEGLDAAASAALDARLVLVLANAVGEPAVLREAIAFARRLQRPAAEPFRSG